MNFRKRVLNPTFLFLNTISAVAFLMAIVAPYIPPDKFSLFAFAATGFPLLLLINVLFLIWWLVQFNRMVFVPIVTLILGYSAIMRTYRTGGTYQVFEENQSLRVMTYNVRNFNIWEWLDDPEITDKIEKLIKQEDPDVILFQEYHRRGRLDIDGYPHQVLAELENGGAAGLAIYSKLPVENIERMILDQDDRVITNLLKVQTRWQGKTISIYNIHLASVGLEQSEYETLKNPDQKDSDDLKTGLLRITGLLHKAYQRRSVQVKELDKLFEDEDEVVIFGGDLNDVPQSYAYHSIAKYLNDSFMSAGGKGFGNTYARGPVPLRIDYLFHSSNIRGKNYRVVEKKFSDHFPLVCDFIIED